MQLPPALHLVQREVRNNRPLMPYTTEASAPSESASLVENLPDHVNDTIAIPVESVPSSSLEDFPDPICDTIIPTESFPPSSQEEPVSHHPPDPASNTTLPQSDSLVIPESLEDDVQPPNSTCEELELPGLVEHTDCLSSCASNAAMPAIQVDASIDARPRQRKRRRHHLVARLKDAVSQRLFNYLRRRALVL